MKKLLVIILSVLCILFTDTKVYSQETQTKTVLVKLEKHAFFYETEYGKNSVMKKTNEVSLELNKGEKRGVFFKFDFTGVDGIVSAKIKFYGNAVNMNFTDSTNASLSIIKSGHSWYASGLFPEVEFCEEFYIKEKRMEKPRDWHEVDITSCVKNLKKEEKNYGFQISLLQKESWAHIEFEKDELKPFIEIEVEN